MAGCHYCSANTQDGDDHTVECQVFRFIDENAEAKADPYSGAIAAINAALVFAERESHNMSEAEHDRIGQILFGCSMVDRDYRWAHQTV